MDSQVSNVKKQLAKVLWDTNVSADEAFDILVGKQESVRGLTKIHLYRKIINGFYWHTIRRIIPSEALPEALSDEVLKGIFPKSLREKYKYVRTLL